MSIDYGVAVTAGPCTQIDLPPVSRLHRHALESVFAFLNLRELHSVLSVSCRWQAAVLSMRSIVDPRPRDLSLGPLLNSRLLHHVGKLRLTDKVTSQELVQLAQRAPQLR